MLLNVTELVVGYGAFQALRKLSLGVGAGEGVTILGANGAGKSNSWSDKAPKRCNRV
jgi:ABC-type branched-subunit amino acid transport system ATPase component